MKYVSAVPPFLPLLRYILIEACVLDTWWAAAPAEHFCPEQVYQWSWWLVTIGWAVQGAGVLAFVGMMVYPCIQERMSPSKPHDPL